MTQLDRLRRAGYRRLGTPRSGFRYVRADGRPISAKERERASELALLRLLRLHGQPEM